MIEDQELYDSAEKKEKELIKKYLKFEMKAIAAMKNLAAKVDKPSRKHSKSEHKARLLSLYRKQKEKILKHYNENYGGEKAGEVEWEWDEIPEEIQIHINFAKKRIFDITKKTSSPEPSQTFSEEEIQKKSKSKTPPKSKSKTPPKSKSKTPPKSIPKKSHKKILDDLKNNKLNQEDMDNILKNLNLKTQKEYLKELIIIGLNKL